jgi:hypothetical protein
VCKSGQAAHQTTLQTPFVCKNGRTTHQTDLQNTLMCKSDLAAHQWGWQKEKGGGAQIVENGESLSMAAQEG